MVMADGSEPSVETGLVIDERVSAMWDAAGWSESNFTAPQIPMKLRPAGVLAFDPASKAVDAVAKGYNYASTTGLSAGDRQLHGYGVAARTASIGMGVATAHAAYVLKTDDYNDVTMEAVDPRGSLKITGYDSPEVEAEALAVARQSKRYDGSREVDEGLMTSAGQTVDKGTRDPRYVDGAPPPTLKSGDNEAMPLAASLNLRANGVVMETMTTGARDDEILVRRQGREGWEPLERPLGNAVAEAPLPLGPARDPKTGFPFRIEKDPQGQNMSTIDWRAANPISDHPAASISVMDRMRMAKFTDSGKWDDYVGSEITEVDDTFIRKDDHALIGGKLDTRRQRYLLDLQKESGYGLTPQALFQKRLLETYSDGTVTDSQALGVLLDVPEAIAFTSDPDDRHTTDNYRVDHFLSDTTGNYADQNRTREQGAAIDPTSTNADEAADHANIQGLEEPPPNELGVADGFLTLSGERTEQELPSMQNENAKTNDFQPQSDGRGNAFDPTATNTGALRGVRPQAVHNASSWGYRKFANDNRSLSSNAPLRLKSDDVGVQRPTRSLQFWHT